MKSLSLILIPFLLLPLFAAAAVTQKPSLQLVKKKELTGKPFILADETEPPPPFGDGGWAWAPINNIKDQHIQELGRFAVKEYNKQSKNRLEFESVFKGETELVAGRYYKLLLKAKVGSMSRICQTIVFEKPLEKFKKLNSFVVLSRRD